MKNKMEYETNANRTSPDPKCRTCTDFKSWAKQQRMSMFPTKSQNSSADQKFLPGVDADAPDPNRSNCPLDKDEIGRATWGLLHTISVTYPEKPTAQDQQDMTNMMNALGNLYPCEVCASDLKKDLIKEPVDASSQHALAQWLCRLHNKVNVKTGKPVFDCSKVYERWRDGWLDGSCD